jgi:hypothetical protein
MNLGQNISLAGANPVPIVEAATTTEPLQTTASSTEASDPDHIKAYVANYYSQTPILADIASCESHDQQFNTDGTVMRGAVVYQDVGIMQINETYHGAEAKALGYDIYTLDGNLAFANWLYNKEGTAPWDSSSPCWDK